MGEIPNPTKGRSCFFLKLETLTQNPNQLTRIFTIPKPRDGYTSTGELSFFLRPLSIFIFSMGQSFGHVYIL